SSRRFRQIAEHHRHSGEDLHGYAGSIHVFDPAVWIPAVIGDFTKDLVAFHHSRTAWFMMIQADKPGITVARVQVRPFVGENVGMKVDLHWASGKSHNAQRSTPT